jgi:hypothetical protein
VAGRQSSEIRGDNDFQTRRAIHTSTFSSFAYSPVIVVEMLCDTQMRWDRESRSRMDWA